MRLLHQTGDEMLCRRAAAWLTSQDIDCVIEDHDGTWQLWLQREDQREAAATALQDFLAEPSADRFRVAKRFFKGRVREAPAFTEAEGGGYIQQSGVVGLGPVSIGFIILCVAVAILSDLGAKAEALKPLTLTPLVVEGGQVVHVEQHLGAIRSGEVWRLLTPIFIHFGWLHLIFNMFWLAMMGSLIEARTRPAYLMVMVVVIGVASNLVEYAWSMAWIGQIGYAGGFSGVAYGLIGYCWLRGRLDPWAQMRLDGRTIGFALAWLALCFTGLAGNIANGAHVSGLVLGAAWGILDAWRSRRRQLRA